MGRYADEYRAHQLRLLQVSDLLRDQGFAVRRDTWWRRGQDEWDQPFPTKDEWRPVSTAAVKQRIYNLLAVMYPDWYRVESSKYSFYREILNLLRVPLGAQWPPASPIPGD